MRKFLSFVLAFACLCAALAPLIAFGEIWSAEWIFSDGETLALDEIASLTEEQIEELYGTLWEAEQQELPDFPSVDVLLRAETEGDLVWISRTGHCYHSDPTCSKMENPVPATQEYALTLGRRFCQKCE